MFIFCVLCCHTLGQPSKKPTFLVVTAEARPFTEYPDPSEFQLMLNQPIEKGQQLCFLAVQVYKNGL